MTFKYEAKLWEGWDDQRDPFTDGDTIWFLCDLGLKTYHASDFRVFDFDAPETWRPSTKVEFLHGKLATMVAKEIFVKEQEVYKIINLEVYKDGKYGRWLFDSYLRVIEDNYVSFMQHLGLTKQKPYPEIPNKDILERLSSRTRKVFPDVCKEWKERYSEFFI